MMMSAPLHLTQPMESPRRSKAAPSMLSSTALPAAGDLLALRTEKPVAASFSNTQRWWVQYHLFQLIETIKLSPTAERPESIVKLHEFIRGAMPETLQRRPGSLNQMQEPTFGEHALALLAAYGYADCITTSLENGIAPNAYDIHSLRTPTALMRAVMNGNAGTTQALLPYLQEKDLQQVNFFGQTAPDIAFQRHDDTVLKILRPAYGPWAYIKAYFRAKAQAPDPLDDLDTEEPESALLLP
jgi:hypothetical protein